MGLEYGMLKRRTAFILGAGASAGYGFPCGMELRDQICTEIRASNNRKVHNDVATIFNPAVADELNELADTLLTELSIINGYSL